MTPAPHVTLHITNLRALKAVRWTPDGVCALVGGNGSGKTTLLLVLKFLRAALDSDLPSAVGGVLGGGLGLSHWSRPEEPIEVGLDLDDLHWRVRLLPEGSTVAWRTQETLHCGAERIIDVPGVGVTRYRDEKLVPDARLVLAQVLTAFPAAASRP